MRHAGRLLHRLLAVVVALAMLAAVLLGGLAWRLSRGPLELPWLLPALESVANGSGYRLSVGSVALAWEGAGERVDRPLDLRLREVVLAGASGATIVQAPSVEVSLSALALLRGQLRPRAVAIDGMRLRAWRRQDGSPALDLAAAPQSDNAPPAAAPPVTPPAAEAVATEVAPALVRAALAELARPPDQFNPARSILSALRRARLRNAEVWVVDRQLDTTWHASRVGLDLVRGSEGGVRGTAQVRLELAGDALDFTATASLPREGQGDAIAFRAVLPPIVPAELARAVPKLQPLEALDARIALTLSGALPVSLSRPRLQLDAEIGPGTLHLARGTMPLRGARLSGEGTLSEFDLRILALDLAPPAAPGEIGDAATLTHITGWLHARQADGQIAAAVSLALDHVAFADLPALWPLGLGGPGTRPWITENITAGDVTDLHVALALRAPVDFSDATVTWIDGAATGHDITVHWLRPVPPIEHGEALLSVTTPDVMRFDVLSGVQVPPGLKDTKASPRPAEQLRLTGGSVALSGLSGNHQFADIDVDIAGPVPPLLALLRHPRIHLLDRRPIPLRDPAGQFAGRLNVAHLPLKDDLTIDEVRIQAGAHLTGVHLGGIAAGFDLDGGTLDLEASNDGLSVQGTAAIAAIPAKLQVEMDFREGPPSQIIQKVSVSATPDIAQLRPLGIAVPDLVSKTLGVQADLSSRRDGRDELALGLDLTPTGLDVPRLNWAKPAGQAAHARARILMRNEQVTAVESLQVDGPGLDLQGQIEFADGRPRRLQLRHLALGLPNKAPATDIAGNIAWPERPGAPWIASLEGASLDAAGEFAHTPSQPNPVQPAASPEPPPGPPWRVDARIARVMTGEDRMLADVVLRAENDGRLIRSAQLTGRTVAAPPRPGEARTEGGAFRLAIAPSGNGRSLTGSAADAGGLLRAFDVVPDLLGGQMTLTGHYDDSRPAHPLSGDVRITSFRMRNAPVVARLLQALSVYGIVTALESPDLSFDELVAPFRLTGDRLELFQARTYNASLGMTAKGTLDIARQRADVEGTIVPAYFVNSLLGRLPLIGTLLSPERGGGLFALAYSVRGPFDDPSVSVNPLSAVTPGFLRGLFGILPSATPAPAPAPAPPSARPPAGQDGVKQPAPAAPARPPAAWGGGSDG